MPVGDGDSKDQPSNLCVDVVDELPHCMDMIEVKDVIRAIEIYLKGGAARKLSDDEAQAVKEHLS